MKKLEVANVRGGAFALLALGVMAQSLYACGGPAGGCTVAYTGNYTDTVTSSTACMTVAAATPEDGGAGAGGYTFSLVNTSTRAGVTIQGSISLSSAPAVGSYTAASVDHWQFSSLSNSNCAYVAGDVATPQGNFMLNITSVSGIDGASPSAHGTLHLQQYVQAPPDTACGAGDVETVDVTF